MNCRRDAHRSEAWNKLDFIVVLFSAVDSSAAFVGGTFQESSNFVVIVTCMKAMRALRPLRLLKRATSLRRVGWSIVMLIRSLGVPLMFVTCILYMFAIVGLNVFLGQFHRCSDPTLNRVQCLGKNSTWLNNEIHFDWVGSSFLAVLSLTSKDVWAQVVYNGLSATGPDSGPSERNQEPFLTYYLTVLLFWWIFMSNIFIGVLMKAYNEGVAEHKRRQLFDLKSSQLLKSQIGGSKVTQRFKSNLLREGEIERVGHHPPRLRRKDLPTVKNEAGSTLRLGAQWISSTKTFGVVMTCLSAASTCIYCFQTGVESSIQQRILAISDPFFLLIFGAENILLLHGQYPRSFFLSTWDTLNGVMVLASLLDYSLHRLLYSTEYASFVGWHPQIMRSLQLVRALRYAPRIRALNTILHGIVLSIGELLGLTTFVLVFAVSLATMMVQLFAGLCALGDDDEALYGVRCLLTDPSRLLPSNSNFRFPSAGLAPRAFPSRAAWVAWLVGLASWGTGPVALLILLPFRPIV